MCFKFLIILVLGVIIVKGQSYNEIDLEDISVENFIKPFAEDIKDKTVDRLLKIVPDDLEDTPVESIFRPVLDEENSTGFEPREYLTSWRARRHLRKILNEMPCGWPQYGIPPLEPYINENLTFRTVNNSTNSNTNFQPIRIDGLANMDIDKLVVGLNLNKVYFDFNFVNITATGKFNTSTLIDMEDTIGLKLNLKGKGILDFGLENLRVSGSFRYKMPLIFGSAKIYDLKITISLDDVHSNLRGTLNSMPITKPLNHMIEKKLLNAVNSNNIFISSLVAQLVEPRINAQLKGRKLWDILWWSMNDSHQNCMPPQKDLNTIVEHIQSVYF